jgi:hypothetical protein
LRAKARRSTCWYSRGLWTATELPYNSRLRPNCKPSAP